MVYRALAITEMPEEFGRCYRVSLKALFHLIFNLPLGIVLSLRMAWEYECRLFQGNKAAAFIPFLLVGTPKALFSLIEILLIGLRLAVQGKLCSAGLLQIAIK